ncbi:MAG: hypothetical protein SVT56_06105 [Chloroflexota bacterium]|nr:hypothetical protein [Chloroflexota bacterium]
MTSRRFSAQKSTITRDLVNLMKKLNATSLRKALMLRKEGDDHGRSCCYSNSLPDLWKKHKAWTHFDNVSPGSEFDFVDAPIQAMANLDTRHPICCQRCKSIFIVVTNFSASILLIEEGRFAYAIED